MAYHAHGTGSPVSRMPYTYFFWAGHARRIHCYITCCWSFCSWIARSRSSIWSVSPYKDLVHRPCSRTKKVAYHTNGTETGGTAVVDVAVTVPNDTSTSSGNVPEDSLPTLYTMSAGMGAGACAEPSAADVVSLGESLASCHVFACHTDHTHGVRTRSRTTKLVRVLQSSVTVAHSTPRVKRQTCERLDLQTPATHAVQVRACAAAIQAPGLSPTQRTCMDLLLLLLRVAQCKRGEGLVGRTLYAFKQRGTPRHAPCAQTNSQHLWLAVGHAARSCKELSTYEG